MRHRVTLAAVLAVALLLALLVLPGRSEAHTGRHAVANWHRWIHLAVNCETKGMRRPWMYGPRHTEGRPWSGFYGGVQFGESTWDAYKTVRKYDHANDAPAAVQIATAERLRRARGLQPWPNCGWAWR